MKDKIEYLKRVPNNKAFLDILSYVDIDHGKVTINNGRLCARMFIEEFKHIKAIVPSTKFFTAVKACKYNPKITVSDKGNMTLSQKSFRARIPVLEDTEFPYFTTEGESVTDTSEIIPVLKLLRTFIGEDATRPWVSSIQFENNYAYATNNAVIVRVPLEARISVSIPVFFIDEIIRVNEQPKAIVSNENSTTVYWEHLVLSGPLLGEKWPTTIDAMFAKVNYLGMPQLTEGCLERLETLLPFCEHPKFPVILLNAEGMHTEKGDSSASMEDVEFNESKWHAEVLKLIFTHATYLNTSNYPGPCGFKSNKLQGLAVGLK